MHMCVVLCCLRVADVFFTLHRKENTYNLTSGEMVRMSKTILDVVLLLCAQGPSL